MAQSVRVTFSLPEPLYRLLEAQRVAIGGNYRSKVICAALNEYLEDADGRIVVLKLDWPMECFVLIQEALDQITRLRECCWNIKSGMQGPGYENRLELVNRLLSDIEIQLDSIETLSAHLKSLTPERVDALWVVCKYLDYVSKHEKSPQELKNACSIVLSMYRSMGFTGIGK